MFEEVTGLPVDLERPVVVELIDIEPVHALIVLQAHTDDYSRGRLGFLRGRGREPLLFIGWDRQARPMSRGAVGEGPVYPRVGRAAIASAILDLAHEVLARLGEYWMTFRRPSWALEHAQRPRQVHVSVAVGGHDDGPAQWSV